MEKTKRPRIVVLNDATQLAYTNDLVKANDERLQELKARKDVLVKTTMFGLVKTKYYKQIY
jgi:hypothetical protein